MSLFLGNLPAHIHQEDLERVFRRFGRCDVQLKKDGYGFAIYEVPVNAESALRSFGQSTSGHREDKGPSLKERSNTGDAVDPNASRNDRWGEPDNDSSDGNGIETEVDFE